MDTWISAAEKVGEIGCVYLFYQDKLGLIGTRKIANKNQNCPRTEFYQTFSKSRKY